MQLCSRIQPLVVSRALINALITDNTERFSLTQNAIMPQRSNLVHTEIDEADSTPTSRRRGGTVSYFFQLIYI